MHAPILAELVHGIVTTARPLTSDVLDTYRKHARRLLDQSRQDQRTHWRSQALTLVLGGLVPWIGFMVFGWSADTMLYAISIDVVSACMADVARLLFADRTSRRLLLRDCRARDTVAIARALRRDAKAKMYELALPSERPVARAVLLLLAGALAVAVFTVVQRVAADYGSWASLTEGGWLLLLSPLTRLAIALRHSMAEGESPAAQSQLLLTAIEPLAAWWLSAFAGFLVLASGYFHRMPAGLSLALYIGAALALGVYAAVRVWRAETDVRRLAARA